MGYKVYYAGVPIHDYVSVLNVKRTILPSRENLTKSTSISIGATYLGYKYSEKIIVLECALVAKSREEYIENLKELTYLLDVDVPQKMIIDDCPDRYCYAVLTGDTSPDKVKYTGRIELNFACYDPYDYALEWESVEVEHMSSINPATRLAIIQNSGSVDTYPYVTINFLKDAYFAQCSNSEGETVLIGTPPNGDEDDVDLSNEVVLLDECETLDGWLSTGTVIDKGTIDGDLTINDKGYAITCINYGTNENGWHGGARRKNLDREVENFSFRVNIEHISTLDKDSATNTAEGNYTVIHSPSINVRSGRGKTYKKLGSVKKGTELSVTSIKSGWGQITYNGSTGYVFMNYLEKKSASTSSTSGQYKVTADPYLRIRKGRGTKYTQVGKIPKGKIVTVTSIKDNWGKVTYSGDTGYVYMKYMKKVNTNTRADEVSDKETVEDRMSRCEVYGFDSNGNKLFKVAMNDLSSYYEYSEPEIYVGSSLVYSDGLKVPKAKRVTVKENGKSVSKKVDNGAYGEWNKFKGYFEISRQTKDDGKQYWECTVAKYNSGWNKVEKLECTGTLQNDSYPTGKLSNILIWMGAFKDHTPIDVCNVSKIVVKDLDPSSVNIEDKNIAIFKAGDELAIDFAEGDVKLNNEPFLQQLDLGSQFFGCPVGESPMIIITDDETADIQVDYQLRWL